ncbi:hypothetical protein ACNGMK_09205 [Campylobacter coli]
MDSDFKDFGDELTNLFNNIDLDQNFDNIVKSLDTKRLAKNTVTTKIIGIDTDGEYLLIYVEFSNKNRSLVGCFYCSYIDNQIVLADDAYDKNFKLFTNSMSYLA